MRAKAHCRIGVVDRRFFSSTTALQREMRLKKFEGGAGGAAETIDRLVGIADRKYVASSPRPAF